MRSLPTDQTWWSAAEVAANLAALSSWLMFPPLLDAEATALELAGLVYADADPARVARLAAQLDAQLRDVELDLQDMATVFERMRDDGFELYHDPLELVAAARRALWELRRPRRRALGAVPAAKWLRVWSGLADAPEEGPEEDAMQMLESGRYLPDVHLIPPCPACGDTSRVQRVVVGLPAYPPAVDEADRVAFAGCIVDENTPEDAWWCPADELSYPWSYPFERTLLVKEPWVSLLVDGHKTWELRRSSTKVRGVVGLSPSGSGTIAGCAELAAVHGPFTADELREHFASHRVDEAFVENYAAGGSLYAWEFASARRFTPPAEYEHPQGAVIWVKLPKHTPS